MDVDEAQARMQEIQRIMERATLFTLLPGMSAIVGGILVLGGCAISYAMFHSLDFADILHLSFGGQAAFCVMWFLIGVIAVLLEVILTTRAAATTTTRARRSSDACGCVLADAQRGRGHGLDGQVPDSRRPGWDMLWTSSIAGAEGGRNPVHRARLDDALRHGRLHGGPVFDPAAPCLGPDVPCAWELLPSWVSRDTASFRRRCLLDYCTLFLGSISSGNNGRRCSHERARQT